MEGALGPREGRRPGGRADGYRPPDGGEGIITERLFLAVALVVRGGKNAARYLLGHPAYRVHIQEVPVALGAEGQRLSPLVSRRSEGVSPGAVR